MRHSMGSIWNCNGTSVAAATMVGMLALCDVRAAEAGVIFVTNLTQKFGGPLLGLRAVTPRRTPAPAIRLVLHSAVRASGSVSGASCSVPSERLVLLLRRCLLDCG